MIGRLPDVSGLEGPLAQKREFGEIELVPVLEKQGLPGSLGERLGMQLDFTWRGRHGVNVLPGEQRKTLLTMRSDVSLNGLQPLESGAARGLYSIEGITMQHWLLMFIGSMCPSKACEWLALRACWAPGCFGSMDNGV